MRLTELIKITVQTKQNICSLNVYFPRCFTIYLSKNPRDTVYYIDYVPIYTQTRCSVSHGLTEKPDAFIQRTMSLK